MRDEEQNRTGEGPAAPPVDPAAKTTELDYFVSRRGASAEVAREVANVLAEAGYSVLVQDSDIPHGTNFIMAMHDALKRCRHFVALLSRDYDSTPFTTAEWTNFYAVAAQSRGERRFVVLRVEDCTPQGLFSAIVFGDLVGVDNPHERRARILAAAEGRANTATRAARLFENVPPPDLNFTGRDTLLGRLNEILTRDARSSAARIAAIHGLGGIGKTSLAAEYVHRHADSFAGVWWVPAEERTLLIAGLAALAGKLDHRLTTEPNQERAARMALASLAGRSDLPFLLIYDNVEAPDVVRDLLPATGARVLMTTRWADWAGHAIEVKLEALAGAAAATFLQKRAARDDASGAARLAASLGYLPLALDHAGAFCKLARMSFDAYAERVDSRIARAPKGASYPASVAATFAMAIDEVAVECPAAERLLGFCAFLSPELIPLDLIDDRIADEDERLDAVMALAGVSLIEHPNFKGEQPAITVHRLVQAAMRARLIERNQAQAVLENVLQQLAAAFPQVRFRQLGWQDRRAMLVPHALAARDSCRALGIETPAAARLFCVLGRYLHARGDYAAGEPVLRDAIAIGERTVGRFHPDVALALHDLVLLCRNSGRYDEADALIAQAIEVCEKSIDRESPEAALLLNGLANMLKLVNHTRNAEGLYREAIAITEKLNGRDHPDVASLLNNLAGLLRARSRHDDAESCYREAIAIGSKAFGRRHPNVARLAHNLANLLRTRKRYAEAEQLYRETIEDLSNGLGPDDPLTARAQRNLAILLLYTKRAQEALPIAKVALRGQVSAGTDPSWIKDAARTYAQVLEALQRTDEADAIRNRYRLDPAPVPRQDRRGAAPDSGRAGSDT